MQTPQTPRLFDDDFRDAYERIPGYESHLLRIQSARVMVVGIGALGNEVVKNLALFDVGHLFLCDFDTIEWANLSHSVLFRKEDAGKKKVDVAARVVRELNPRVRVTAFDGPLSELGLGVWRQMDAIIGCLDNRGSRLLIDRICGRAGKEWIDAGLGSLVPMIHGDPAEGILQGAVQIFSPRNGYCYEYYLQSTTALEQAEQEAADARRAFRNWQGCREVGATLERNQRVPTTPTMAALVGSIQTQEAIRLLSPGVWGSEGIGDHRLAIHAGRFDFNLTGHPRGAEKPPLSPEVVACDGLSARQTTLGAMVERARTDLGPGALVELGFQYCRGLRCSVCQREYRRPFKLGSVDARCPECSTDEEPIECTPMAGRVMPDYIDGREDFSVDDHHGTRHFLDMSLHELGVPLYDVLTASVHMSDGSTGRRKLCEQRHYELSGDAAEALGWPPRSVDVNEEFGAGGLRPPEVLCTGRNDPTTQT